MQYAGNMYVNAWVQESEKDMGRSRAQARARSKQIKQTQDEPQWIVAQRIFPALTIPGFS